MLLNEVKEPFDDKDYIYELKLAGIRCIAYLGKDVVLQNKRFKDVTEIYPELSAMFKCVKKNTVLDGELVVLSDGKPDFYALQKRSLCRSTHYFPPYLSNTVGVAATVVSVYSSRFSKRLC